MGGVQKKTPDRQRGDTGPGGVLQSGALFWRSGFVARKHLALPLRYTPKNKKRAALALPHSLGAQFTSAMWFCMAMGKFDDGDF